jgi:SPP1 gp7 family putative phage head morphogenesis protein
MSEQLVDESGEIVPFTDFKELAGDIFDQYNDNWLKAEYDTAITASRSASKWIDIQKNKKDFPYLKYIAVMDAHTCEICAPLDGITLSVDDPFWDENATPQHFFCECTVESLDDQDAEEEGISEDSEVEQAVASSQETKDPLFNFNPGKEKVVFQDTGKNKHPYFEVSKKYKELAKNNFGLEIPEA